MKNQIRREKKIVYILLTNRKGETVEAMIDRDDLPTAETISSWRVMSHGNGKRYVLGTDNTGKAIPLHRLLSNAPEDKVTHLIDGNPLNCRRSNILVMDRAKLPNKRKPNKDTGHRNIYRYDELSYMVKIHYMGKEFYRGKFATIEDAIQWRDGQLKTINEDRYSKRINQSKERAQK